MEQKEFDLLNGTLWDKLLMVAIPIAIGSMLQQIFSAVDVAVVGKFCGKEALAAVGSNGSIIYLIINLFVGLSVGSNAIVSRYIGQKNDEGISKAVHTSILLAAISGMLLCTVGALFAKPILRIMAAPADVIDLAALYLKIFFAGMPVMMLYNFSSAILRSKGDTKRPLVIMAAAGLINAVLNVIFVTQFNMSVDGVAYATVISNAFSAFVLLYLLHKEEGPLKLTFSKLRIDMESLKAIASVGLPAGMQGMLFSISNVVVQYSMNKLGSTVVAGSSAALNCEFFAYFIVNAFAMASVTFIAQNYGAGKLSRCRKIVRLSMTMATVLTIFVSSLMTIFGPYVLRIFTSDPAVIEVGMTRVKIVIMLEFIAVFMDVLSGCLRGFGYSAVPAVICFFGVVVVRLVWIFTIYAKYPSFGMLMAIFPISWAVTGVGTGIAYFYVMKRIRRKMFGTR